MFQSVRLSAVIGIVFFACLSFWPALDEEHSGPAKLIDADTIEVGGERHRLYGVDAVEIGQRCRRRDERGKDLIIARDYITTGMRERAAEIVSLDFGPRSDVEIENRLRREVEQERLTGIDHRLIRDIDDTGLVAATDRDAFQQSLRVGRLRKLKRLVLADELRPGQWRLEEGLEDTLRRMGERSDIIKTMHREMVGRSIARSPGDYTILDPGDPTAKPVIGRVVARGLSDELKDRHYLIVDGMDGRTHYVDIGRGEATEPKPDGSIVRVTPKTIEPRRVDRTVAEVAAANDGRYTIDLHLKHDPRATEAYAETHVRRLEVIRRATGGVARAPNGTWIIAPDHLDRVVEYERRLARAAPVIVEKLSHLTLDRQVAPTAPPGSTASSSRIIPSPAATPVSAGRCARLRRAAGNG